MHPVVDIEVSVPMAMQLLELNPALKTSRLPSMPVFGELDIGSLPKCIMYFMIVKLLIKSLLKVPKSVREKSLLLFRDAQKRTLSFLYLYVFLFFNFSMPLKPGSSPTGV